MKRIVCFFLGHNWEPPVTYKEDWHAFEDVGPQGGLTLSTAPGKGSGDDENYVVEITYKRCSFCDVRKYL